MKPSRSDRLAHALALFGLGLERTGGGSWNYAIWRITVSRHGHTFGLEKRNLDEVEAFISSLRGTTTPPIQPSTAPAAHTTP